MQGQKLSVPYFEEEGPVKSAEIDFGPRSLEYPSWIYMRKD